MVLMRRLETLLAPQQTAKAMAQQYLCKYLQGHLLSQVNLSRPMPLCHNFSVPVWEKSDLIDFDQTDANGVARQAGDIEDV